MHRGCPSRAKCSAVGGGGEMGRGCRGELRDWCASVGSLYLATFLFVFLFFCVIYIHDHGVLRVQIRAPSVAGSPELASGDTLVGKPGHQW